VNLVDSSAWLEFFSNGHNAKAFSEPILSGDRLLVPTIVMYEVLKVLLRECGESEGLRAVAAMREGVVMPIDEELALNGAKLSLTYQLPMADALILACARARKATIWTQNSHFSQIKGVRYIPKK